MKQLLFFTSIIALLTSCSKDICVAEKTEGCPTTREINNVCGCDNVTYINPSTAECHQIYDYCQGKCED